MREVCYLIAKDGRVLWSDASASPVALPDSSARWRAIWQLRDQLAEIAHSHPIGPLAFSAEDESTMSAVNAALGRVLRFSIVAPSGMLARVEAQNVHVEPEPPWAATLRAASGMIGKEGPV